MMKKQTTILMVALLTVISAGMLSAQDRPSVPWRYGAHLGLNYNMAGVGYAEWLAIPARPGGSFVPHVLNDGSGIGLYGGLNIQYMLADWFGLQGRLSYDNRSLTANDDQTHQKPDGTYFNDEFVFHLGLINLDVLGKLYIGESFHFTAGGGIAFKIEDTYHYRLDSQDPEFANNPIEGAAVVGSFLGGFGYDIPLSEPTDLTQWFLTPFIEATYMVGMKEVDFAETQSGFADGLSVVTIRAGLSLAFGDAVIESAMGAAPAGKLFSVAPPEDGIYTSRMVEEYMPVRPHVFFDKGNAEIPTRYNRISSSDTTELIEKALHGWSAADLTNAEARKYRQGEVYYNILNILGYRMNRSTASVTLIGSDPDEKNGEVLAESTKKYVVETWGVAPDRLVVKGQVNPRIPSGTARTPAADRPLADIENRRVEIVSDDPTISRRVVLKAIREARDENEVYINITTNESIASWQATITGNGQRKSYGPYSDLEAYLDPTGLLASNQASGQFSVEVIAKTVDGRTLSESESFALKMNPSNAVATRHTLIFEYSEEDPVKKSREFLDNIVTTIPNGATVIISGFTDNIGTEEANMKLSVQRANEVKKLLLERLSASGKKATVRASGYGESSDRAPFSNDVPEGRMYNRTVVVDIFP